MAHRLSDYYEMLIKEQQTDLEQKVQQALKTAAIKPSGTMQYYMAVSTNGIHPSTVYIDGQRVGAGYTRVPVSHSFDEYLHFRRQMCARCDQELFYSRDGYRKHRDQPAWLHRGTDSPWCKPTKQHGPKSRYAFPVPSLYTIPELGVMQ